jgi:hypothetical protein
MASQRLVCQNQSQAAHEQQEPVYAPVALFQWLAGRHSASLDPQPGDPTAHSAP